MLALHAPSPPARSTFVHSQPVLGMEYDPSFAGGWLVGQVFVPQAVMDQLAARQANYNVSWSQSDLTVAWLAPGRLLAYIDSRDALLQVRARVTL